MNAKVRSRRSVEAEQDAVLDAQFSVLDLLKECGVTKSDLAKRLGVTKSSVSQFFAADANPTLRQLARYCDALDASISVKAALLNKRQDRKPSLADFTMRLPDEILVRLMKRAAQKEPTDAYPANENYYEDSRRKAA